MRNLKKKYPLEYWSERVLKELVKLVRKAGVFFFEIPKKRDDKIIYMFESLAWIFLTIALVLKIWR